MKLTGIVRKVDDLGRIVIPKEIRNSLFVKEGTPMEIVVTENMEILLKKANILESISEVAEKFCSVLYEIIDFPVIICDSDKILSCVGLSKKSYLNKNLSEQLINIIHNGENYTASDQYKTTLLPITENDEMKFSSQVIIPILLEGKCIGLIVIISNDKVPTNCDVKIMQAVSKLITNQLSN